ncbi:hypothetical protein [Nitrosomonas marina]|uniref:Type IV pilus assembly protein PilO n=1 Tax=Nitrosomonas marina TaxID=917 RepID=A0A1H8AH93_9PROT|nr:hypothetical protein [Nitrosomonas marina]SEM69334.1 hypothetical protein SAMN05216325_101113 [Nitrosomonas marina]
MDNKILRRDVILAQSQRIMLLLRWQVARLGNTGKIGVGLLVVAGIFFIGAVLPEQNALETLREREKILRLQVQSGLDGAPVAEKKLTNDQALQQFYNFFPRFDSSPFWIRELVRVAQKQGLEINSGDFRLTLERDWRLSRYDITMPVSGRYAQIRAFMADALEAVPALAITGFSIKRDNVQSALLEVRFEMSLYLNE